MCKLKFSSGKVIGRVSDSGRIWWVVRKVTDLRCSAKAEGGEAGRWQETEWRVSVVLTQGSPNIPQESISQELNGIVRKVLTHMKVLKISKKHWEEFVIILFTYESYGLFKEFLVTFQYLNKDIKGCLFLILMLATIYWTFIPCTFPTF